MSTEAYDEYLASDHWQDLRRSALDVFTRGCIITGETPFNLHHLNYVNKGRERFWADIVPLRQDKHLEFHRYADEHGLCNHDLIRWVDDVGYRITEDTRRRLESARQYNVGLSAKTRIKRKKAKTDATKKREKKRASKVQGRHIAYYNLEEVTIIRGGKARKVLIRKKTKPRRR